MAVLDDLADFDPDEATLSLWVFKKTAPAEGPPSFKARWVQTTEALDNALKTVFAQERDRIEEVQDYSLLAQNNEGSSLSITIAETHAPLIVDLVAAETPGNKVTTLKQLQNSSFFLIKLTSGDTVVHAVSKTDQSWRARKVHGLVSAFFQDDQLGLDERLGFDFSRSVDFLIVGENILIRQKGHFESILSYKQAHREDFAALRGEPQFVAVIADVEPLVAYIGENKIQLRRASAIRQKGHYKDQTFMLNLRARHAEFGLNIQFDAHGKIVPTPETCADIMRALLDHRLSSAFSAKVYDVPDATVVAIAAH